MATISNTKPQAAQPISRPLPHAGKRTDRPSRFTTKKDAEAFAASVEVSKMRGEYVAPRDARVLLGELGPRWLDRQRGILKPSGYTVMETTWRLRVKPRWGARRDR